MILIGMCKSATMWHETQHVSQEQRYKSVPAVDFYSHNNC